MIITKQQLRQIVKEELETVSKRGSFVPKDMAEFLGLGKGTNTLKQFIKDNPAAAGYVGSGVKVAARHGAINPEALKTKIGSHFRENTTMWFRSKKEKQISDGFYEMTLKRPWAEMYKEGDGIGYSMIGRLFNTSIVSGDFKIYEGSHAFQKGGQEESEYIEYISSVAHTLSKEYFTPKGVYLNYLKEYKEGAKSKGAGAARLYQYTADYIENITGQPIPGSTKNPVKDMQQLPTKPMFMYSYLITDTQTQLTREYSKKALKKTASDVRRARNLRRRAKKVRAPADRRSNK